MENALKDKTVAILGYGNQGHAHALNLRDVGIPVIVGARPNGKAWWAATKDGFTPMSLQAAAALADVVMFLLPDQAIAPLFRDLAPVLEKGRKWIGFAHGFAYHFNQVPRLENCGYFLAAPKGAGAVLRSRFQAGEGLPTVFAAAPGSDEITRAVAEAYARAIAGKTPYLKETTFQLETEGDLFGEQTVLVGGVWALMQSAFDTLVKNGHPPESAFFDVCQELQATLELFLRHGPAEMAERISPTALYGAATRGPRVIGEAARAEMQKIFDEIRSGEFGKELLAELDSGGAQLQAERERLAKSDWQKTYETVKPYLS